MAAVSRQRASDEACPVGSLVYADKAYNDYALEDLLREAAGIDLSPIRKKNSRRGVSPATAYLQARGRKIAETVGSLVNLLLPKSIHAVTPQGFELRVSKTRLLAQNSLPGFWIPTISPMLPILTGFVEPSRSVPNAAAKVQLFLANPA